jgi:hypothetical protein
VALRPHALLPRQYDHRKVLATTVDAWGRALWLICPDARLEPSGHGKPSVRPRTYPYDALLVIDEDGTAKEQSLHGVSLRVCHLDALPNGRFVLEGYGAVAEKSAQIYGRDGRRRHSFELGRAIEFVMADRRHHLWSAYGDEGVYSDPISYDGLVRWDSGGNRQWSYSAPGGVEYIDTVYALNVDDGTAWASYYPTFPLLEVRADGRITVRRTPVTAPRGIAVHEDEVVMLGGNRQGDRLHRCRMTASEALLLEEACLTFPNGTPLKKYARPVGRGRHLYLHGATPRQWYVMDM